MSKIIGWATGVNKKILDSTSISIGDKGFVEDSGDSSSFTERRLNTLYAPDTYNVFMDFDWAVKDEDGNSELDRFVNWYKYRHKRGVNPFEFPSISKFNVYGSTKTCYYQITSPLAMQKSGYCMRVSMTWKEYYSGIIEIPDVEISVNGVNISVGQSKCKAQISFTQSFDTEPTEGNYPLFISTVPLGEETVEHFKIADTVISSSYGNILNYTFQKPSKKGFYYAFIATKKNPEKSDNEIFTIEELTVLSNLTHTFEVR